MECAFLVLDDFFESKIVGIPIIHPKHVFCKLKLTTIVLIGVVTTVGLSVAEPLFWDAVAARTPILVPLACKVI